MMLSKIAFLRKEKAGMIFHTAMSVKW